MRFLAFILIFLQLGVVPKRIQASDFGSASTLDMIVPITCGASGTIIGLGAGIGHKLCKRLTDDKDLYRKNFLPRINSFRESSPVSPSMVLAALSFAMSLLYNQSGVFSMHSLIKQTKGNMLVFGSERLTRLIRSQINRVLKPFDIDISGHTISQVFFTIQNIQVLHDAKQTHTLEQQMLLNMFAVALGLIDSVWMFNTSSKHHSIADVAFAVALSFIVFRGIHFVVAPLNVL